jgi:ribosomal protein S21
MTNCVIYPAEGESIDSIWRRFRKATDRANVLKDYSRSREFVAKPQRRAAKSSKARARRAKYENGGA